MFYKKWYTITSILTHLRKLEYTILGIQIYFVLNLCSSTKIKTKLARSIHICSRCAPQFIIIVWLALMFLYKQRSFSSVRFPRHCINSFTTNHKLRPQQIVKFLFALCCLHYNHRVLTSFTLWYLLQMNEIIYCWNNISYYWFINLQISIHFWFIDNRILISLHIRC